MLRRMHSRRDDSPLFALLLLSFSLSFSFSHYIFFFLFDPHQSMMIV